MDRPVEVTTGGVRWLVAAECRDRLLGPDGLRLADWLRSGQAQVVKHGPHRTVYRVALPGLDVYIKHYRLMDLRAWLRELVRPAKAWLEYRQALAVAARYVPTVVPLAVGRQQGRVGPNDSFLITRSLDGTEALSTFVETRFADLPPARQARVRQHLAVELARFVARLHETGIVHHDLHAGNLLLARDADDSVRLFLIDLHATRVSQPLSERARFANLVILNRYFSMRASQSDRLRFWRAYVQFRGQKSEIRNQHALARELEARTWTSNLRFWRQRDGRCLLHNRYYQLIQSPAVVGHAVRDLDRGVLEPLLADPDAPFRQPGVTILKDSRSSTVAELDLCIGGATRRVIYKRFRATSWTDPWTALIRPTAAQRSWINGQGLRERDLPTARPLAVLHRRRRGLVYDGYLLTEKIEDAVHLHAFVNGLDRLSSGERRGCLRRAIHQVARLIRDLHRRNLSHRDLKATNIMVSVVGRSSSVAARDEVFSTTHNGQRTTHNVSLIDLVGVRLHRTLSIRRRVQDLARLHASFCRHPGLTRTDKLRFLRTYQQWGLFGKHDWKSWWRQIEEATQAKVERNRRSGRPLG